MKAPSDTVRRVPFDEIIGQSSAVTSLRHLLASGRLPHALVFHGPEGVGKATVARTFAAALLCGGEGHEACGACAACAMMSKGHHPDFMQVCRIPKPKTRSASAEGGPEAWSEDDLHRFIVVSQIRELSRVAGLTPREGRRRVFLIDPADRMNAEAQNGLLKTLEEPPGAAVLVLVASRPHLLLPTVRSRCFGVGFSALNLDDLSDLLAAKGVPAAEAGLRAELAEGRPGIALDIDVESRSARRDEVLRMIEDLTAGGENVGELPSMAAALAGKDEPTLLDGLGLLQSLLRDVARRGAHGGAGDVLNADLERRIAAIGRKLDAQRAAELVSSIDRARGYLRFNANRTLVAEALLAAVAGAPLP